jgi:16S rRNA (cytosine967-C5)-methyltransferase
VAKVRRAADPAAVETRREAVRLIGQVLRRREPLDEAFGQSARHGALAALPARDRAFVRALAATALRRLGQIEHLLARFLVKPLPAKSGNAREILIVAAAQILFMRVPAHAASDTAVEVARGDPAARHFAGLINAVLRRLTEAGLDAAADRDTLHLNTPAWLWRRWCAHYGEDTATSIAERHAEDPPLDITVKRDPQSWAETLGGDLLPTGTVRIAEPRGLIEDLPGYASGDWWVQDAAAALPARLLGPVAGLRVLDLCAAPGGKTAQLAAAGARVTALDQSESRLARLQQNLARLRLDAEVVVADATGYRAPESYDAVLLDAPCTATGIARRNPDIPHLKSESDLARLAPLQARMLDNATSLVKPGGLIVYCTCSLEPEEGAEQIARLLHRTGDLARVPIEPDEVGGADHLITPAGDLRTLPSHGLDGFFAARLRRR